MVIGSFCFIMHRGAEEAYQNAFLVVAGSIPAGAIASYGLNSNHFVPG